MYIFDCYIGACNTGNSLSFHQTVTYFIIFYLFIYLNGQRPKLHYSYLVLGRMVSLGLERAAEGAADSAAGRINLIRLHGHIQSQQSAI